MITTNTELHETLAALVSIPPEQVRFEYLHRVPYHDTDTSLDAMIIVQFWHIPTGIAVIDDQYPGNLYFVFNGEADGVTFADYASAVNFAEQNR